MTPETNTNLIIYQILEVYRWFEAIDGMAFRGHQFVMVSYFSVHIALINGTFLLIFSSISVFA